jgi:hypothetical protein
MIVPTSVLERPFTVTTRIELPDVTSGAAVKDDAVLP